MRLVHDVVPALFASDSPNIIQCTEQVRKQYHTAVTAVEPLDIAVLRRMAGLCIHQIDIVGLALFLEYPSEELWAIVAKYVLGHSIIHITFSKIQISLAAGMEMATSCAMAERSKSSNMLRTRNLRPHYRESATKSIDQVVLRESG